MQWLDHSRAVNGTFFPYVETFLASSFNQAPGTEFTLDEVRAAFAWLTDAGYMTGVFAQPRFTAQGERFAASGASVNDAPLPAQAPINRTTITVSGHGHSVATHGSNILHHSSGDPSRTAATHEDDTSPQWLRHLKRSRLTAVLAASVVVASGATTILTFSADVRETLGLVEESIAYTADDLRSEVDVRYGYSFTRPKTWLSQGEALDGYTFTAPGEEDVEVRTFGSTTALYTELGTYIDARREDIERSGGKIIEDEQARATVMSSENGARVLTDAPGWLLRYSLPSDGASDDVTILSRTVLDSGRFVTIEAQAPSDDFDLYQDAYGSLIADLEVSGDACPSCTG
ncbi:hypothetical protein SAMN04488107_0165 [Geodermatophilus saharensis]|uniref:Uncharacterized protein n=2 Tax=Geodermatophilus saharensis TaxID=1137994 RepID=A0A238ZLT7_9ACTN|nr:hypothetical protein SAMN04488107_0165 [Geodermatophilus saharensis]